MGVFLDDSLIDLVDKEVLDNNQEALYFDDLKILLSDIKYNYISSNSKGIDLIRDQIIKKFSDVSSIHDDYVYVFKRTIEKYHDVNKKNIASFEDLGRNVFDGK